MRTIHLVAVCLVIVSSLLQPHISYAGDECTSATGKTVFQWLLFLSLPAIFGAMANFSKSSSGRPHHGGQTSAATSGAQGGAEPSSVDCSQWNSYCDCRIRRVGAVFSDSDPHT